MYASYIPLDRHYDRLQHFKAGLRHLYAHGKRAHVLYGSKESADHLPPIVLSPLYLSMTLPSSLVHLFLSALPASLTCSSSPSPPPLILSSSPSNSPTYDEFDPLKGFLTHEVDRLIILDLIHHLTRYIQKEKVGYTGERNARGQRDGRGKCILPSGDVFVGDFKEGRIHGTGKMTYKNGSIYEGEYARGNMEGTGKFTSPGGHVYVGQWKRGQMNGQGVFTSPSGDRYEGEFVDNQKWGKGKFIYASGSVYEGQFIEDTIEGLGRLIYTNGDTYDGEWRAGRKHGKGKVFHAKSGVVEEGMWADGQRVPYCP
ncbi:hypothetical protein EON65_05335 [archaeon]|nr:MAG: hypothetical protein EON65_05335 [archaeon]